MEEKETVVGKISSSKPSVVEEETKNKRLRVNKKDFQVLIEEFQKQLEFLKNTINNDDDEEEEEEDEGLSSQCSDSERSQLHDLLKSTVESPNFFEKLASVHASAPQGITGSESADEGSSWDMINKNDIWVGGTIDGDVESDQEDYVIVNQEDIKEGIACFMTTYLLSIQQSKELSPNQLQEALSKTFSAKKKKGKLQKAWDGSKVIYNVASWGATAVGIYQNPALVRAASVAFWSSCGIISKLF